MALLCDRAPGDSHQRGTRFLILLALLVLYIVVSPISEGLARGEQLRIVLLSLALLAALTCLQFRRLPLAFWRWFGILTLVSGWVSVLVANPWVQVVSVSLRIVFFAVVAIALIYQIAASRKVSLGVIIGAIDGYLLLGIMGAGAFLILEQSAPGSVASGASRLVGTDVLYFAFITMATVGYGDIVPVSPAARSVAILLAVTGQLYVAILISMLVGKYISDRAAPGD